MYTPLIWKSSLEWRFSLFERSDFSAAREMYTTEIRKVVWWDLKTLWGYL